MKGKLKRKSFKKSNAYTKILFLAILGALLTSGVIKGKSFLQNTYSLPVNHVIDGDTLVLQNGQRIRLLGSDAPEIGFCGGEQAKKRLEDLVLGKKIILKDIITDKYNRQIALVYVEKTLVNEIMLREGWGRNVSAYGSRADVLRKAHQEGFSKRAGIFSELCRIENPPKKNCLIKGNINDDQQKYYFFPGCYEYNQTIIERDKGEAWYCTEKEAQAAGFVKPKNCP